MTLLRNVLIATTVITTLATQNTVAQDELYLEITQPGLRRVAVAAPPLMVLPGTPAEAAKVFQETLDNDLAAAAPLAVVDQRLYALVEDDPRPDVLNQRWPSIGEALDALGSEQTEDAEVGRHNMIELATSAVTISGEFNYSTPRSPTPIRRSQPGGVTARRVAWKPVGISAHVYSPSES